MAQYKPMPKAAFDSALSGIRSATAAWKEDTANRRKSDEFLAKVEAARRTNGNATRVRYTGDQVTLTRTPPLAFAWEI